MSELAKSKTPKGPKCQVKSGSPFKELLLSQPVTAQFSIEVFTN